MKVPNPITSDLIAPCGMNCALCSNYLAYVNNLKRSQCAGCRARTQKCTYLFGKCTGLNHEVICKEAVFCYECGQYPCAQIERVDKRYRQNYHMSMKDNLEFIKSQEIGKFIEEQYRKYRCERCGGLISVHNRKCFKCDPITKLIDKSA